MDPISARLRARHPQRIDLSLERMTALCAALGDPQLRLPPVVHVAGTNGKGSTVAFIRAMAEAAGLRVHVYSSPHLVRFNERIRLAGTLISDAALDAILDRIEAIPGEATVFESTTAAAFVAMSEVPADLALIEVGLGGSLDATNVLPVPQLAVITPRALPIDGVLPPGAAMGHIGGEGFRADQGIDQAAFAHAHAAKHRQPQLPLLQAPQLPVEALKLRSQHRLFAAAELQSLSPLDQGLGDGGAALLVHQACGSSLGRVQPARTARTTSAPIRPTKAPNSSTTTRTESRLRRKLVSSRSARIISGTNSTGSETLAALACPRPCTRAVSN